MSAKIQPHWSPDYCNVIVIFAAESFFAYRY
ncbi:hypothetical protein RLDS_24190 [Sphingobium lactosutens DS20]|uniref:Uncharacterized protein n=1 Tax=Sphingobium lactosutens DS20 TaxID=1331060 RepID=T0HH83_9SPHN|nr:hypothetical protein RLDS_24190 [Sphingobium lactosutens DS20]